MHQKPFKIVIDHPCQQNWASMAATEKGKFCSSCTKEVIDFTVWEEKAITDFFAAINNQPICGRFRTHQLDRSRIYIPSYLITKPIKKWQRYLLILLLCFGTELFQVDILIGNHQSLYAQTSGNKSHPRKKAKLRLKTYKYVLPKCYTGDSTDPTFIAIMGFTQTVPDPYLNPPPQETSALTKNWNGERKLINSEVEEQPERNNLPKEPNKNDSILKQEWILANGSKKRYRKKE